MSTTPGLVAGLHPASADALRLSNLALMTTGNASNVMIAGHELAAEAHRKAAAANAQLRPMHEAHANIHDEAAESLRQIVGSARV